MGSGIGEGDDMRLFDQHCDECHEGLEHCHGTLVLHADETAECDGEGCGAIEATHRWWMSCVELGCGCTGDEAGEAGAAIQGGTGLALAA